MVRNILNSIVLSIFILSPFLLFTAEFNASVSSTDVKLHDSFSLNLTLKDISAKSGPQISPLNKDFVIHSEHRSTNTTILNGKYSSSIVWKFLISAKNEGMVEIPPIKIETTSGPLSTKPITLNVSREAIPKSTDEAGLNVVSEVSNASPYKNEPFIYTALLTSKLPLYNVQTHKIEVKDAIVELLEKPKLEERIIDNVAVNVIELSYLITPLKTGTLTIPSITIQGATPQKRKGQSSFFDDDFDPFMMMQGLERLKSFNLSTQEIKLDIQPAIGEITPWLPAKSLSLEEVWPNDQTLRVGEPISRGFIIKAEGLKASQLPRLDDLQSQGSTFKVYADKPEEQEKIVQKTIHSSRKEQYTLIPEQPGPLVLPEITINWWDTVKKEKRSVSLPSRTLQILPALESSSKEMPATPATIATQEHTPANPILYAIIAVLTLFLATAILWGYSLQRKIKSLTEVKEQKPPTIQKLPKPTDTYVHKEKKEKLPDLNPT